MDFFEELQKQRQLALKTLNKYSDKLGPSVSNSPSNHNRTEYVEPGNASLYDISDLAGKTIELQTPQTKEKVTSKLSGFKHCDVNARSTLMTENSAAIPKIQLQKPDQFISPDVQDILATSTCESIRKLRDSLVEGNLPRTADMSFMSSVRDSLASGATDNNSFWNVPMKQQNGIFGEERNGFGDDGEEFEPAEAAVDRLLEDELQWEQEFADIPRLINEEQTTRPVLKPQTLKNCDQMNFSEFSAYMPNDVDSTTRSNFSIGQYFNQKSSEIQEIASNSSTPINREKRVPMIDISDLSLSDASVVRDTASQIEELLNQIKGTDSPYTIDQKIQQCLKPIRKAKTNSNTENLSLLYNKLKQMNLDSSVTASNATIEHTVGKTFDLADTLSDRETNLGALNNNTQPQTFVIPQVPPRKKHFQAVLVGSGVKRGTFTVATTNIVNEDEDKENLRPEVDEALKRSISKLLATVANESRDTKKRPHSPDLRLDALPAAQISQKVTEPFSQEEMIKETPKSTQPLKRKQLQQQPIEERNREHLASSVELDVPIVPNYLTPSPPRSRSRSPLDLTASPSKRRHLLEGVEDEDSNRFYQMKSPESDSGKYSLPSYQLTRTTSATSTPNVAPITRTYSQCSTGSEYNHRDGLIPLKATRDEISWGSVKLRKASKKSIQIKNTSPKRLCLKAVISGPGFQISADIDEAIVLQGHECRSITVYFCPTVIGAAVGALKLVPSKDTAVFYKIQGVESVIKLYGYGGHASINFTGIYFPPTGLPFLPLCHVKELLRPVERTFYVHNKGNIAAFVVVMIELKGILVDRSAVKSLKITPSKTVIAPNSTKPIKIRFQPSAAQLRKLIGDEKTRVLIVTNLILIYGDEPTRQRLKSRVQGMQHMSDICSTFPEERTIDNLDVFKESLLANMDELYEAIRQEELILTVDRFADETMLNLTGCTDQPSLMFKTLCSAVVSDDEDFQFQDALETANHHKSPQSPRSALSINPSIISINPIDKQPFQLFLKNNLNIQQFFQFDTNARQMFIIRPNQGTLLPGERRPVLIEMRTGVVVPRDDIYVVVYLENSKFTIPVRIDKQGRR